MDWIGLDWIGGLTDCMGRHTKEGEIQQAEQQLLQMIDKIMLKKKKMLRNVERSPSQSVRCCDSCEGSALEHPRMTGT